MMATIGEIKVVLDTRDLDDFVGRRSSVIGGFWSFCALVGGVAGLVIGRLT